MQTDQNPKQLVAQRLKDATNILVTVGHDPSVDSLAAALALTLILDKLEKTPTAVFSGVIPPAIEFLEPGKTFDTSVDGLRDFIIALDKEKADRLRYKVEDDVVRVFITPYKTTITEKDLSFSQGDFNVDLVIAFGVEKREDLDAAITAHGRILHDAAVITINQFPGGSSLGEIDWSDAEASSLCEMLMSLTESLQSGLLDKPIATAILTGLVASTDRFRNEKTSPKVMTMAAQLMAAGANQQLIADKLEEAETVSTGKLNNKDVASEEQPPESKNSNDGEMIVEHDELSEAAGKDAADRKAREVAEKESAEAVAEAKEELQEITDTQLPPVMTDAKSEQHAKTSSWRDIPSPVTGGTLNATTEEAEEENRKREEDMKNHVILSHDSTPALGAQGAEAPVMNASSLPPTEPSVQDIFTEYPISADAPTPSSAPAPNPASAPDPGAVSVPTPDPTPAPVLEQSQSLVADTPAPAPIPEPAQVATGSPAPAASMFQQREEPVLHFEETPLPGVSSTIQQNPTLADLEQQVSEQGASETSAEQQPDALENARAAVNAALTGQPFDPAGQPLAAIGAQPLGSVDHTEPVVADQGQTVSLPPLPPLPPLPDFSTLPPLPGEVAQQQPEATPAPSFGLPEQPASNPTFPLSGPTASSGDPGQFKLPGQN